VRLVVGIDPGSGKSSPTGLAIIEPDTRDILHISNVRADCDDFSHRIKGISQQVADIVSFLDPDVHVDIYLESFVMRGKGGEMLARLTGALMAAMPYERHVAFVHNTTMKKVVAGHGRAEKFEVGNALYIWAAGNKESQDQIEHLLLCQEWDMIDAIGLAVAGDRKTAADKESQCNCSAD
jgi:Holliday junction resolvasome RuvABC endonuclease subunit